MIKNRAAFLADYEALMYKHGLCLVTYDGVDEIDPEDIPEEIKSFGDVPKGPPVIPERIAKAIQPNGRLESGPGHYPVRGFYIDWRRTYPGVGLEGEFTPAELRAIADHMEKCGKP